LRRQATGVRRENSRRFCGKRIPANEAASDREAKPVKERAPDFIVHFSAKAAVPCHF